MTAPLAEREWSVKIRAYLGRHGKGRAPDIADGIGCTPERARLELALMRGRGVVDREGTAHRGWVWKLTDAGQGMAGMVPDYEPGAEGDFNPIARDHRGPPPQRGHWQIL